MWLRTLRYISLCGGMTYVVEFYGMKRNISRNPIVWSGAITFRIFRAMPSPRS